MAEEQVMTQTLVLQNEHEKALEKLNNMLKNNLTAKQQGNLKMSKDMFFENFLELSWSLLGLSENQLRGFNISELKVLDKLISRKAKPWAICQILFTFGVPVVGWVVGLACYSESSFYSWAYLRERKYLKKRYGEEFLSEILENKLQKKS